MSDSVPRDDLRLPADALILYYLLTNGQGTTDTIASTIARNDKYVSRRISALESDLGLVTRVWSDTGPVTLTAPAGVDAAQSLTDQVLPEQQDDIAAATPYSVSWE